MKSDDNWVEAGVDAVRALSPTVRELRLRPVNGVQPWTPGAHVRVQVDLGVAGAPRADVRHYSLVGLPQESRADGCYRIAVKRADPGRGGSRYMWGLQPGSRVLIAGP